jgi:chromosome segregation ATPase
MKRLANIVGAGFSRSRAPKVPLRGTRPAKAGAYCLLITFLWFAFALDCSAQTLAEAARKERERQKHLQSKVTVTSGATATITAGTAGVSASVAASSSGTSAAAASAKPSGPTDNQGRDEKYWRAAFQKARDDVKRSADKVQLLELKLKDLNTKLLTRTDMYDRENRLAPEITATQKELDEARKNAEQAKQKLASLEDDLRKSGGLPGWSR